MLNLADSRYYMNTNIYIYAYINLITARNWLARLIIKKKTIWNCEKIDPIKAPIRPFAFAWP